MKRVIEQADMADSSTYPSLGPGLSQTERDPLEMVLSDFMLAIRSGQSPDIEDFARRFPQLADQIRELFPLVGNLERWKSDKEIECLRRSVPKQFPFDKLGCYRLVRELGRGGMGVVFQAVHTGTQQPVAIKLLPWRFAADMAIWKDRLRREATTIAALKHPHIVQVFSFSEDQGYPYYAMQLVDGVSLDKIIRQLRKQRRRRCSNQRFRPAPAVSVVSLTCDAWRGFARIGEQVALALAYAHDHQILHNDMKPSNLLVRPNGQVIVTDFGIGRFQSGEHPSSDDHTIGTLRYMAPERLNGSGDSRSDIYSLGVTLYELATQVPAFEIQERAKLIESILHQPPQRPQRRHAEIPAPLERIILKAMAKSPTDRYQTSRDLAEDLRRFINRQPIKAAEQRIWQRAISWCHGWARRWRRNKT